MRWSSPWVLGLVSLSCCTPSPGEDRADAAPAAPDAAVTTRPDAGPLDAARVDAAPLDAGTADAAVPDAGILDATRPDAWAPDAAPIPDATLVNPADSGPEPPDAAAPAWDAATPVTGLTTRYWLPTFTDDFRGKPDDSPESTACYDELTPRCAIWSGSAGHACESPYDPWDDPAHGGFIPPLRENMAAAVAALDSSRTWSTASWEDVHARYTELVRQRMRHLNKCVWTSYQQLNWWGTDYQGSWSTRHDPTRVEVDPAGKGYLKLTAARAPVAANCVHGGTVSGPNQVNCQVKAFAPGELVPGVGYWVDAGPDAPGVYYAGSNGTCPHGGTGGTPNCRVHAFTAAEVEPGVSYWVDADPAWPGVYYGNTTPYRCQENTEYPNGGVLFRQLTCPVLTGAIHSPDSPPVGTSTARRGVEQRHGRFEVKARIPKGQGAFPAAWLLPRQGGWPYAGGEIDIMEARDAADSVFQTYHHGRCINADWTVEQLQEPGNALLPISSGGCASLTGFRSLQYSRGLTIPQRNYNHGPRPSNEFFTRDHVFAVEWTEGEIRYFINNVNTHTVQVGTTASGNALLSGPALPGTGVPMSWRHYAEHSFPPYSMYWILNHSVYVPPSGWDGFQPQEYRVDSVKSFRQCQVLGDFCPCGGFFAEGVGCTGATAAACAIPVVDGAYASPCQPAHTECVAGGIPFGPNCQVHAFAAGEVSSSVEYWVDADPRWPGVFYGGVNGGCPHGGTGGSPNCQVHSFRADELEDGVVYWVDADPRWPGVFYEPDFRQ